MFARDVIGDGDLKRQFIVALIVVCMLFSGTGSAAAAGEPPEIIAPAGILIDAETGTILYEKNIHEQHYPASTTKMLTAILALENLNLTDKVPIDEEISFTGGSRIYLLEGEDITVEEVMYGMMLESANDAAVAFGKMISGTTAEFTALMNRKAAELGATDSNFVNPNGLHDPAHLSTVYDLAMIAKYCMQNEKFREFVSTYQHTVNATNLQEARYFYNTNRLLYDNEHTVQVNGVTRGCKYDGVTGIKTGWTSDAGGCLAAAAERDGTEFIAVVMGSTDMGRFADCIALLDYGFANYKTVVVKEAGTPLGPVKMKRGAVREGQAVLDQDVLVTLPLEASASMVTLETSLLTKVEAPAEAGRRVGEVKVCLGDQVLDTRYALLAEEVEKGGILSIVGIEDQTARKIFLGILFVFLGLVALLALYIVFKRRQIRRRKQRRLERQERLRNKPAPTADEDGWDRYRV